MESISQKMLEVGATPIENRVLVSEHALEQFEASIGAVLPVEYREFLKQDGGSYVEADFPIPEANPRGTHNTLYRDRLSSLPSLADALGNTASLETAIAGMDSYERAKQIRRYGFVSLGVGALLCVAVAITRHQREDSHAA